ncbi:50S ribosomal protein L9 [Psychrobacter sanguinis]|uniref:50S ribosomal protein L9 n=1 Tax=Psychrobacter sanguinis TaxID=861445 RepID=UPI00020C9893|nr:50S ribosomal protein L9 [Psychrobacter sanguinis]EGK10432.1 5-methyltetrahydropteroyltriglutamate--homocysteine S-methyltransferase [Psychrobacter sp. 1501(2011)]MCC3307336.1 50S ribosomal protein L9 [Psychrobacter sanguinis]MCC3344839.1 50S ribosomal protein L9 [Psychrobacter sanguinis]MCD9152616.1 50S ribosomal protein L9 [Psychrobacter sanguinis]MDY3306549.1 50S ribosomal protein L9 [Psychrobacter sanguinis]
MQVILLQRIVNLGKLGETVDVKSGYGRNYLIPQGKALPATPANVEKFEARRAELEAIEAEELAAAQKRADALTDVNVIMRAKSGEDGKLFGSIGTRDIADALTKSGLEVDRAEVKLPEGTLRQVGEYNVDIQLHHDIFASILVTILSEDGDQAAQQQEAEEDAE